MPHIRINQDRIDPEKAARLVSICPFKAIDYSGGKLEINAGCKMCRLCIKKGPAGCVELVEDLAAVDKGEWKGVAVYAEQTGEGLHNVSLELLGKARELARVTAQPVYCVLMGSGVAAAAEKLLLYGADKVYVYDAPELKDFKIDVYANAFEDFIRKVKPSSIIVGATNLGRTLAPRVAARFRTGLTADCTRLEMKETTDLVQIRPAFGGNIMAQIVTPNHRPQFCTARYKVFAAPEPVEPTGELVKMELPPEKLVSVVCITEIKEKPKDVDISEADVIVAVGRGLKSKDDLPMVEKLAEALGAQLACTRPLVEAGWFDAKRQIGLSGRTVKAKLIIAIGISGAIQFVAGMSGSECIAAINSDPGAQIFGVAHYGLTGDLYEIIPALTAAIKGAKQ